MVGEPNSESQQRNDGQEKNLFFLLHPIFVLKY